jgi:hypothetical protein
MAMLMTRQGWTVLERCGPLGRLMPHLLAVRPLIRRKRQQVMRLGLAQTIARRLAPLPHFWWAL